MPRPSASGAYKTLLENVMQVNHSGRNRAEYNTLPHGFTLHDMVAQLRINECKFRFWLKR
jgi:hypothetical protein